MKDKYDVGVFGVWSGCNYGSIATYYALHEILRSMGKSVLMIDKPIISQKDVEHGKTHSRRFAEQHYMISKQYKLDEFYELNSLCDAFMIGSDQVWNYGISKNFGNHFYLDFAEDDKKKIAYAVSFGHGVDFAPPERRQEIANLMSRFDGISTREADGVRLCKDEYGIKATQVLDPVFLADTEIFHELINKSKREESAPFLATYILDPTPEKREAILHISKELGGVKIVNMLDGLPWLFDKNQELMNLPNCIENLTVENWLYYISHAEFVITDSCHGASFALIFKKNFIPITNKRRGYSRFASLSEMFGFKDRLVTDPKRILTDQSLLKPVNYSAVDKVLQKQRKDCRAWLEENLNEPKKSTEELRKINVIGKPNIGAASAFSRKSVVTDVLDMKLCSGCGTCVNSCPKDALTLKPNKYGYYKPSIIAEKCIGCGKCSNVCTALHLPNKENSNVPDLYAFIAKDNKLLEKSSSGGIFSILAEKVLEKGGCIVGAAWTEKLTVEHIIIDGNDEMDKLRKSKYMQSYVGTVYRDVKEKLEQKKPVLFSGCPCQAAGLKAYLGKDYDDLLIIDLLCGNSPSAMFFQKYLQDNRQGIISAYEFRHKDENCNWNSFFVSLTRADGSKEVRTRIRDDDYQRVYHNHTMCPPHCEHCIYQSLPRFGDITIGDFWGISKRDSSINTKNGVSAVLVNNTKGERFLKQVHESEYSLMKKVPLNWLGGNGYAVTGRNFASSSRDAFYELVNKYSFSEAVDMALKPHYQEIRKNGIGNSKMQAMFNTKFSHFRFDPAIWQQYFTDRTIVLTVPSGKSPPKKYASLYLGKVLERGRKYTMHLKFKVNTSSNAVNIHIKASENDNIQLIGVYKPKTKEDISDKLTIEFVPDCNIYDEFMIGASQISGEGNFFELEYLYII